MNWRWALWLPLFWMLFAWHSLSLRDQPRLEEGQAVLRVRLPPLVQLAYAGGDPYLAANLNVFRSIMVDVEVREQETYRVQGQLQLDASRFNPRQEDNYYLSAALLPWNGEVEAAQGVLLAAARSRSWDMWPAFFYAFNAMYFERDMARAGHWAEVAAQRNPRNAAALQAMAAKWYERGDDPAEALGILRVMHEQSRDANFRLQLEVRMQRIQGLMALREAARAYVAEQGRPPARLEALIGYAGLQHLPQDPMRLGYVLSSEGRPELVDHLQLRKP